MTTNINIPAFITSSNRVTLAFEFANRKHTEAGQIRKYTNEPYIVHPIEVAGFIHTYARKRYDAETVEDMVIAALLHDTVEDTNATYTEIERMFGVNVRNLVFWLTDVTTKAQGNRRVRKEIETMRLVAAPGQAKFIKLCDFISNTKSIVEHDEGFAKTYLMEKQAVIQAFTDFNLMYHDVSHPAKVCSRMLQIARQSLNEGLDAISKP